MALFYPEWIYDIDPQQQEYLKCTGRQWFNQMRFCVNHPELSAKPSHGQIKERFTFVSGHKFPLVWSDKACWVDDPSWGFINRISRSHKTPAFLLMLPAVSSGLSEFYSERNHPIVSVCSADSLNPSCSVEIDWISEVPETQMTYFKIISYFHFKICMCCGKTQYVDI